MTFKFVLYWSLDLCNVRICFLCDHIVFHTVWKGQTCEICRSRFPHASGARMFSVSWEVGDSNLYCRNSIIVIYVSVSYETQVSGKKLWKEVKKSEYTVSWIGLCQPNFRMFLWWWKVYLMCFVSWSSDIPHYQLCFILWKHINMMSFIELLTIMCVTKLFSFLHNTHCRLVL